MSLDGHRSVRKTRSVGRDETTGLARPWVSGSIFFVLFVVFGAIIQLVFGDGSLGESILAPVVPGAIAAPLWVFVIDRRMRSGSREG